MRVFQYCPFDIRAAGGVEKHISFLSDELRLLGCETSIGIATPSGFLSDAADAILHSHGDRLPPSPLLRAFGFNRWIHTLHGTSIGRAVACREYLGLRNYYSSSKEAFATHLAGGIICVSENVVDQAQRYFRMPRQRQLAVISNAATLLDLGGAKPSQPTNPYFLYLGRGSDHVKNVAALKAAFLSFHQSYPHVELRVAPGEGFEPQPGVQILGTQSSAEVVQLLRGALALVLPSFYEADSIVLWEAMAQGTPLIASPAAAARRHIKEHAVLRLVEPADHLGLRAALEEAAQNPGRGQPYLRSWKNVAQETLSFYDQVLRR